MSEYIIEMDNIVKEFPGVRALDGVSLKLRPGKVHGLMGENGAGKSTLMKCLIGIHEPTSGTITYKGEPTVFHTTQAALDSGISMIHQELSPVRERSVSENIWLGREPLKYGFMIDHQKMHQDSIELFKILGLNIDPREKMGNLTVAKMQMVEIAKAVSYNSSVVIMDEPTSSLTETEVASLFAIIADLKAKGVAILYTSHKMDEIFEICDDLTVFRDGTFIATDAVENYTFDKLITQMVGREMSQMFPKVDCEIGDVIMSVKNLSVEGLFEDVSFDLHRGEILGFAGLIGAGRTEVAETIFGMHKAVSGEITIEGKPVTIRSPQDAIKQGIGLLTEDRRLNGIVGVLSVMDNAVLANLGEYGMPLKHDVIKEDTKEYVGKLSVKTPTIRTPIANLSGGNQQKVLVARWLMTDPDILIVDEPTRGIDVGAKAEIHALITQLAGQGKAIIMISSEMPEVLGMSDRVLVMSNGRQTAILDRADATQESVMKYATIEAVEK